MAVHALVLLLAPIVLREPVGQGNWEKNTDPLQHRVASLMAGAPVTAGLITVVPLHARVPSEAGHGRPADTVWETDELAGRLVFEDGRYYLRVINPTDLAVLVPAGTVFSLEGQEVYVARDAVVPANFAALFPAHPNQARGVPAAETSLLWQGILPPAATGALVRGDKKFAQAAVWTMHNGVRTYISVLHTPRVANLHGMVRQRCASVAKQIGATGVGAVFLVAGRPVAAHVFATNELFAAALPDLLQGVAVQAREWEIRAGRFQAVAPGSARGRALSFLRRVLPMSGTWSESYGAGFEVVLEDAIRGVVGHAIVDPRRTVLHAGYFAAGVFGPAKPGQPGGTAPVPPGRRPPEDGKSETPTGGVRPRPTIAEQRARDRKRSPR